MLTDKKGFTGFEQFEIGATFKNPKFRDKRGKLRTLDRVVANPMWNQDWFTKADYDKDELDRFPPIAEIVQELNVIEAEARQADKRKEYYGGSIPWVKSGELNDNYILETEEHVTEAGLKNSSAKIFPPGTVLIALYGATLGKTSLLRTSASTNQAVCGITPGPDLDPGYLRYHLISLRREPRQALEKSGASPSGRLRTDGKAPEA